MRYVEQHFDHLCQKRKQKEKDHSRTAGEANAPPPLFFYS
jgi:hypothetical protein